jgi:cytosine/adenosine deaminase-related metal-dependent hydrolase
VEPDGLRTCAEVAARHHLPVCIHLAETRDEAQFTRDASGPLAEHLRTLQIWDEAIPAGGCGPVELAGRLGLLTPTTLLAHVNYVTGTDIDRIARSRASVAFCPRTHHAFGHDAHRFREMLRARINVCIGTDSLASNPSLSVLDELRFLRHAAPDVPASTLLEMATVRGARALGFEHQTGSLAPGKYADIVVIPLDAAGARGPDEHGDQGWESILNSTAAPTFVFSSAVECLPPP